jgi:hypothetical protein
MSVILQGYQLRELVYGSQVIKKAQTPPNSGSSATLFTVAGGAVIVTGLLGHVSTALSGTTGAIALGQTPTGGVADTGGIATAGVVGGAVVGTWVSAVMLTTGLAGAVQANILAGATVGLGMSFVIGAGIITVTTSVATMTGAIDWYLSYLPLDTGAAVS